MAIYDRCEHGIMKFQAVLFDCDGVLVDSEPITNGVLRDMLFPHMGVLPELWRGGFSQFQER